MPCESGKVTIGVTPVLVVPVDSDGKGGGHFCIKATDKDIFVGCQNVTVDDGYPVAAGHEFKMPVGPNDPLYAVVESGRSTVRYFKTTR